MAIPPLDLARIQRFCDKRNPPEFRDVMRLEVNVRGNTVTILDRRPPWEGPGAWDVSEVARLRYTAKTGLWMLYWSDRDGRWHRYWNFEPTPRVDKLLAEIERDPTCIFFG